MEEADSVSLLSWPIDKTVYLTLDLECDYGTALDENVYEAARETPRLVGVLEQHSAPLTCFLQTEVLDEAEESVRALEDAGVPVEFHSHSHTHPTRVEADVETEVRESVRRIRSQFETEPLGYRFPDGDKVSGDYEVLARNGVSFSSTLFPSWRPGRFNNAARPRKPFYHRPSGILEFPFAVHSNAIRIPVSISYLKFLGRIYESLVHRSPPDVIIFDMHMHDLVVPETFDRLPPRYKAIYGRNKNEGFEMLRRFLRTIRRKGYQFESMSTLPNALQTVNHA